MNKKNFSPIVAVATVLVIAAIVRQLSSRMLAAGIFHHFGVISGLLETATGSTNILLISTILTLAVLIGGLYLVARLYPYEDILQKPAPAFLVAIGLAFAAIISEVGVLLSINPIVLGSVFLAGSIVLHSYRKIQ